MPVDINWLRAERGGNPEAFRQFHRDRNLSTELVDRVIELDKVSGQSPLVGLKTCVVLTQAWRQLQTDLDNVRTDLSVANKQVWPPIPVAGRQGIYMCPWPAGLSAEEGQAERRRANQHRQVQEGGGGSAGAAV